MERSAVSRPSGATVRTFFRNFRGTHSSCSPQLPSPRSSLAPLLLSPHRGFNIAGGFKIGGGFKKKQRPADFMYGNTASCPECSAPGARTDGRSYPRPVFRLTAVPSLICQEAAPRGLRLRDPDQEVIGVASTLKPYVYENHCNGKQGRFHVCTLVFSVGRGAIAIVYGIVIA
jgi:hypothetical protein